MNKSKKTVKKAPSPATERVEGTLASWVSTDANTDRQANISSVNATIGTDASQLSEGEGEASLGIILSAIKKMEHSMNVRFNELEASLSGVQSALTANAARITDLEEASTDYE